MLAYLSNFCFDLSSHGSFSDPCGALDDMVLDVDVK